MTHAAGVLIRAGNSVLLLKRAREPHLGSWGFPGGSVEGDETPEQAARREMLEETGIYLPMLGPALGDFEGFQLFGAVVDVPFDVKLNNEHTEAGWFDLDALPEPLHPGCADFVRRAASVAMDRAETLRQYDVNGWYEVPDNPISKAGIFPYSGRQVGHPDPAMADEVFAVYRPAEELAHPDCIASFRLLPWIDDHIMLGPEAERALGGVAAEEKGIGGVIGERVYFADGYLRGNIKVFSGRMAQLIAAGKKELSAGYRCRYDAEAGTWEGQPYQYVQRAIRGNHLALVDQGRMGPDVAVQDRFTFACDAKEANAMTQKLKLTAARAFVLAALGTLAVTAQGVALDKAPEHQKLLTALDEAAEKKEGATDSELTVEQLADIIKNYAPQIRELMGALQGEAAAPAAEGDEEGDDPDENTPTEDEPEAEPDMKAADTEPDMKAAEDAKALRREVVKLRAAQDGAEQTFLQRMAERDALVKSLAPHIGTFDHSAMTLDAVRKYAVEKVGLAVKPGNEAVALDAWLRGAARHDQPAVRVGGTAMDGAAKRGPIFDHFAKEA